MAANAARPSNLKSWFWATRPFSMSASVAPVLVGSALALNDVDARWLLFAVALTASMAIQIGTNLTDEYSDHRKHGGAGKLLAPHKVIQRGLLSERAVLIGIIVVFGYGIAGGLFIVSQTGWPILAIGLASVAAAYLYAGGPYPLGNYGIGEPVVFLFMGPVMVMGAYYVQTETITWTGFVVSLPIAFIVTAILHCNNLRDISEDQEVGKRSIAAALGVNASRWGYATLLAAAYGTIAVLAALGTTSVWVLLGLLPAPWAYVAVRSLFQADDRMAMNRIMVRSAKLHGWTGVTLAAGLAIAASL
jgi:1,4-dihydroxy-2-naphthoate octaprenyltransferase